MEVYKQSWGWRHRDGSEVGKGTQMSYLHRIGPFYIHYFPTCINTQLINQWALFVMVHTLKSLVIQLVILKDSISMYVRAWW